MDEEEDEGSLATLPDENVFRRVLSTGGRYESPPQDKGGDASPPHKTLHRGQPAPSRPFLIFLWDPLSEGLQYYIK